MTIEQIKALIKEGKIEEANAAMDELEQGNQELFKDLDPINLENKALEKNKRKR